jgi:hypothetical protein
MHIPGFVDLCYKANCTFDACEGKAHIYDCTGGIGPNSFTKSELMSIYLSHIVTEFRIPREGHRELVRFTNTLIRDHEEFVKGKKKRKILACILSLC